MYFVLFSGPPRAGKDTAAEAVMREFYYEYTMRWEKFSFPNKRAFAGMMNAQCSPLGVVNPYEKTKDEIIPELGVSYRQWQIDYSEKYMKPLYGDDIFARLLLMRQRERIQTEGYLCVVSDCGFQVEVDTLANAIPPKNLLFIKVIRDGCTYDGDSRQDIRAPHSDFNYHVLYNDKDTTTWEKKASKLVGDFLKWKSQ